MRYQKKFRNTPSSVGGLTFPSKLEKAVYELLKLREKAKELTVIRLQDKLPFYVNTIKICEYWPDFKCLDLVTKEIFWVEAKGVVTDAFRFKRKLWQAIGPGKLEIWKGSWQRPYLDETIIPKEAA